MSQQERLTRSATNKLLGGVCGGIAEYFGWDPSLVRLGWVIGTLFTSGGGLIVYILALFIMPSGDDPKETGVYSGE
ncbi:phage shock protein PspC (stress-responsive transcriptional regulator) [Methanocalculus alkaliphilus]|uniref:PspC domain-containing protein n=1 Tax=Methanocalculus alkaliphilus TaxID=768730 RepID=UPI0020A1708C|nr:PspC domain-containing protein [Methanocalculus alkaliphilus]MCP1715901.1 phage shock protein PspC (stress-responsive transcriptional regulator) [Methanocalculus alkaliphilus]